MAIPSLTAVVAQRIYASVNLPAGYQPSQGPAIVFTTSGGAPDYAPLLRPTLMFRCYGVDEATARRADRALFDAFHGYMGGAVATVVNDVLGQLLAEPDTQWRFVLSYYRALIFNG